MNHRVGVPSIVVLLIALTACGAGRIHSRDETLLEVMTIAPRLSESSARHIARADLASFEDTSLETALRRLRPEWLRVNPSSRQVTERAVASVYVDNVYAGDLEALRLLPVSAVIDVEFVVPSGARDRFGAGCRCAGGAIVVLTRNIK